MSVPLKILLMTKGLSPWMEPLPPSRVNPTPPAPFSSSTLTGAPCSSTAAQTQFTKHGNCSLHTFNVQLNEINVKTLTVILIVVIYLTVQNVNHRAYFLLTMKTLYERSL